MGTICQFGRVAPIISIIDSSIILAKTALGGSVAGRHHSSPLYHEDHGLLRRPRPVHHASRAANPCLVASSTVLSSSSRSIRKRPSTM